MEKSCITTECSQPQAEAWSGLRLSGGGVSTVKNRLPGPSRKSTGIGSYPGREWVGALRRLACAGFGGGDPGMDPGMDQEHRGCGRFAKKIYPKAICLL